MSQAGIINIAGGGGAGSPVQTLTGNTGGAVPPTANNINVLGDGTFLTVTGDAGTSTLTISETRAINGTGTTVGAVTADLITLSMGAVADTFTLDVRVAGFESTTPAGVGYFLLGTARTTGAAATLIGTPDRFANEEAALLACQGEIVVSANNVIVRVTGVAGLTINWRAQGVYTKVS